MLKEHISAVCILGAAAAGLCTTTNADAGVIAYWRFEPGALTTDSSGHGHTLTNSGATTSVSIPGVTVFDGDGGSNANTGSVSFNGTSNSMQTAATLDLSGASELTIEWFMKPTSATSAAGQMIFEHSENGNNHDGAIRSYIDSTGLLKTSQYAGSSKYYGSNTNDIDPTQWTHYAVTMDRSLTGAAERIKVYVDGVAAGTYVQTGNPTNDPAFINYVLYIGARNANSFYYKGLIDEMRISDQVLTPSQFLSIPEPASEGLLLGVGAMAALKRRRAGARH